MSSIIGALTSNTLCLSCLATITLGYAICHLLYGLAKIEGFCVVGFELGLVVPELSLNLSCSLLVVVYRDEDK